MNEKEGGDINITRMILAIIFILAAVSGIAKMAGEFAEQSVTAEKVSDAQTKDCKKNPDKCRTVPAGRLVFVRDEA